MNATALPSAPDNVIDLEAILGREVEHQNAMRTLREAHAAVSAGHPSPALSRAAKILRAWSAWRTARGLDQVLEASAFATMLAAWGLGFCLLCPAEPTHHHRAAPTIVVLR